MLEQEVAARDEQIGGLNLDREQLRSTITSEHDSRAVAEDVWDRQLHERDAEFQELRCVRRWRGSRFRNRITIEN